nr:MAG TPA: Herpesvirus UL33-like protein [Caudoviricetes sp.]
MLATRTVNNTVEYRYHEIHQGYASKPPGDILLWHTKHLNKMISYRSGESAKCRHGDVLH